MNEMKQQKGFTLIELMIVVAIIGILAAVALPAYQDYTTRAKISEGISLASAAKTAVSEHYLTKNSYPTNNSSAGYTSPTTEMVSGINIASGLITVTYTTDAGVDSSEDDLQFSPIASDSGIQWVCRPAASGGVDPKFLPSNCRS